MQYCTDQSKSIRDATFDAESHCNHRIANTVALQHEAFHEINRQACSCYTGKAISNSKNSTISEEFCQKIHMHQFMHLALVGPLVSCYASCSRSHFREKKQMSHKPLWYLLHAYRAHWHSDQGT